MSDVAGQVSIPDSLAKKVYLADRERYGTSVLVIGHNEGYRLPHLLRHSPDGFEWGYGGAGPADLARCMLIDAAGEDIAEMFYQDFKAEVIARQLFAGFQIAGALVKVWLEERIRSQTAAGAGKADERARPDPPTRS